MDGTANAIRGREEGGLAWSAKSTTASSRSRTSALRARVPSGRLRIPDRVRAPCPSGRAGKPPVTIGKDLSWLPLAVIPVS
jgi:hypothetical protein